MGRSKLGWSVWIAGLAIAGTAAAALAQDAAPTRRAGWWEITVSNPLVRGGQTVQMCTDAATERSMSVFAGAEGQQPRGCSAPVIHKTAGGWSFDLACTRGKIATVSSGIANGDFQTGYHVETTTRMTPAPIPQLAEIRTTMDARWLGPCPEGRKPGDMVMNGQVVNLNQAGRGR
jgi:hypothetical protein